MTTDAPRDLAWLMHADLSDLRAQDPGAYGPGLRRAVADRCFRAQRQAFAERDAAVDGGCNADIEAATARGRAWDHERKRWHVGRDDQPRPRPAPAERLERRHQQQRLRGEALRDWAMRATQLMRAAARHQPNPATAAELERQAHAGITILHHRTSESE